MRELSVTLRKVVTCIAGLVVGLIITMASAAKQQARPDHPRISIPYTSPNIPELHVRDVFRRRGLRSGAG